jgi:hypothetical protein
MNQETLEKIIGYKKVTDLFGYWPSFHDAEVVSMRLDRDSESGFDGPIIQFGIHAFTMTDETNETGHYKCINHAVVEIKLDGAESIDIEGFNHQNAIEELTIEEIENDIVYGNKFKIEFEPAFGVSANIVCRKIEVTKITLGIPKNSVYEK